MLRMRSRQSSRKSNFLALTVSSASLAAIFCCFDPAPAGEDLSYVRPASRSQSDVPLPPDAKVDVTIGSSEVALPAESGVPRNSMTLDNDDAIMFSLLLLQDGARFLKNQDTYTVVFNKQERIQGDLSEVQKIEMKVRHSPAFSVYMKWKTGDTGRQLLYNEEYDDKKMVVKLGGLKGRLLPALKLDPVSPEAMSAARYPCTEAGLLAMVNQLISYRQQDLNRGHGVTCVRLPNCQCDERNCYCFQFDYEKPDYSPEYRKGIVMIDSRYHIPMQVINYTWTKDTEGLTEAELDEQTLIENYSFSQIDFGRQLVVEDFSRDNPAYRM